MGRAGCSTASGPTYSVSELQPRDRGRTFQVNCHGFLSDPQICMKIARKVCGDQPVHAVNSARTPRDGSPPTSLLLQCGAMSTAALAAEQVHLVGDMLFATGLVTLTTAARASLDKLLSGREDRTYTGVVITGHTDSVGSDASNRALSKRRAEVVAGYLKAHGPKVQSMSVTGRRSADPVASNATAEGRATDRRVFPMPFHGEAGIRTVCYVEARQLSTSRRQSRRPGVISGLDCAYKKIGLR